MAIAWEHGLSSWTALKQRICDQSPADCQVLPQLSWLVTRFRPADQRGWTPPAEQELGEHFAPEALTPQTDPVPGGHRMGLGWIISPRGDLAWHAGAAPPASAFLRLHLRTGQVQVILASRLIGLGPLNDRLLRSGAQATR